MLEIADFPAFVLGNMATVGISRNIFPCDGASFAGRQWPNEASWLFFKTGSLSGKDHGEYTSSMTVVRPVGRLVAIMTPSSQGLAGSAAVVSSGSGWCLGRQC